MPMRKLLVCELVVERIAGLDPYPHPMRFGTLSRAAAECAVAGYEACGITMP